MVERIVNVPINFKVNDAEVLRYEQRVKSADQATEKLRSGTKTFTDQSTQGFRFSSKAIEGMEVELARLRQVIKLTSVEDSKRLTELTSKYKSLSAQLDHYKKQLLETNKASQTAVKETKSLSSAIGDVYQGVRLFISAQLARELISIGLEAAKLAGNVEGVEKAFNRLPNATLLLNSLREATHGTVNDLMLMQRALMANNFRIPLENLGTLLEFAAVKAQQTGQEVNHLVDYIVSGIGYRSIKRLDDLGFTANRVKEALGGVSLQAASMGQVMTAVTQLMNEDLQKTGGFAETSATHVANLETAYHELRVEVSKQATSSWWIIRLEKALENMRLFAKGGFNFKMAGIAADVEQTQQQALDRAKTFQDENKLLKTEQEKIAATDKKLFQLAEAIKLQKDLNEKNKESEIRLTTEIEQLTEKNKSIIGLQKLSGEEKKLLDQKNAELDMIKETNKGYDATTSVLSEQIRLLIEYRDSIRKVADEVEKAEIEEKWPMLAFQIDKVKKKPVLERLADGQMSGLSQAPPTSSRDFDPSQTYNKPKPLAETDWGQAWLDNREQIMDTAMLDTEMFIQSEIQREVDGFRQRIDATRRFYDEQILLAGDNDKAKQALRIKEQRELDKLNKQLVDKERKARLASIIVSTAAGIARAFVDYPWPAALVPAGIVAASGAAQYAAASRARGYAKGEVDIKGGTPGKDSIPAMIMPGESVITTEKTKQSKNTLKMIHSGKLNDRILKELVSGRSGGSSGNATFDDSRLLKKLDEVKDATPDLVLRAGLIYEARKKGENYKQYIRSKSMGY